MFFSRSLAYKSLVSMASATYWMQGKFKVMGEDEPYRCEWVGPSVYKARWRPLEQIGMTRIDVIKRIKLLEVLCTSLLISSDMARYCAPVGPAVNV